MIWGVVRWTGRPVFAFGWTDHTKPWTWRKSEGPATRSPKQMAWTRDWIKISLSHGPDTPLHKCTGHLSYHRKTLDLRRFKTFSLNRAFSAPLDPHKDPASTICPHALCPTLFLCKSFRPRNTFCRGNCSSSWISVSNYSLDSTHGISLPLVFPPDLLE